MIMNHKHLTIPYREETHGDFAQEWLPHKKVSGWWYLTGYLQDLENPSHLYSYQYTVIKPHIYGMTMYVSMIGFTNFQTKEHLYHQRFGFRGRKIFVNNEQVVFQPYSKLQRNGNNFQLDVTTEELTLDLQLNSGKGAFWHGDDGVLVMGLPDEPRQRTVYYSYPNMPTTGDAILRKKNGETVNLKLAGKSWFDRQWGPYEITNTDTYWEWFSLRFFDDEEIMLFAFPQHPYHDGSYIDKEGERFPVRNYSYTPHNLIEVDGYTFSEGWDLTIPGIKEEKYKIVPLMKGQVNLAYFELMAEIINMKGERVGYCFVELLPGVRGSNKKISPKYLLKKR